MSSTRKITLRSSDGKSFLVDEAAALLSATIERMIEDANDGILQLNIIGSILVMVIEYCNKHVETPKNEGGAADDELKNWDAEFVKVDGSTLFDLLQAAKYLDIKGLLDLICQTIADRIKAKTPDEIIKIHNILKDFTSEEEEEVRGKSDWALE